MGAAGVGMEHIDQTTADQAAHPGQGGQGSSDRLHRETGLRQPPGEGFPGAAEHGGVDRCSQFPEPPLEEEHLVLAAAPTPFEIH
jgi:hypothetical protein